MDMNKALKKLRMQWLQRAAWPWRRVVSTAAGLAILILTPFLAVSESSIKSYIDSWLNDCVFVIEQEQVSEDRIAVKGYISGKPPKSLPITFSGKDALINRIQVVNEVERGQSGLFDNLGLHPQTDWACPGTLCENLGRFESSPKITVVLSDLHQDFTYPLFIFFDDHVSLSQLKIYVQFDAGLIHGVCRVERANPFNWFVRTTKFGRFIVLLLAFVLISVAITFLRRRTKNAETA